ncbi:hypothetical protein THIOKS12130017 [Thiocapsa sp. KS1]|nr:hypothetical protein THIOKS12130017 [Thiocapsa sp. KS1]
MPSSQRVRVAGEVLFLLGSDRLMDLGVLQVGVFRTQGYDFRGVQPVGRPPQIWPRKLFQRTAHR